MTHLSAGFIEVKMAKFQKGVSGNPGGKPRIRDELKKIPELTSIEVNRVISQYVRKSGKEIQKDLKNMDLSIFELNLASALDKGRRLGDLSKLAYCLDRTIGKIKDNVTLSVAEDSIDNLTREQIQGMPLEELERIVKEHFLKGKLSETLVPQPISETQREESGINSQSSDCGSDE